jgi:hypothetical protein
VSQNGGPEKKSISQNRGPEKMFILKKGEPGNNFTLRRVEWVIIIIYFLIRYTADIVI